MNRASRLTTKTKRYRKKKLALGREMGVYTRGKEEKKEIKSSVLVATGEKDRPIPSIPP